MHANIYKFIRAYIQFIVTLLLIVLVSTISLAQDFQINHGLNGSWYNPATSGQGILLEVDQSQAFVFMAWYTFNPQAVDGDNSNHQWYTASGNYSQNSVALTIYQSSGGGFDNGNPVETIAVGSATLEFSSCTQANFNYTFNDSQLSGTMALQRLSADILCQTFSQNSPTQDKQNLTKATNNGLNIGINGSWYQPETTGQGILFDLIPNANTLFGGWFTYAENSPNGRRWYSLQGNYTESTADLKIYETSQGLFNQASEVTTTQVGTAQFNLTSCTNATLVYNFDNGKTGEIALQRLIPTDLCAILAIEPIEIPDEVEKSTKVAFYDTHLITMLDDKVLAHQTVVVENGVITQVGHFSHILPPSDAVVIDASDKYLGPGLSEMHLHIARGGQVSAQQAGLLLIANGFTNVLNMGDIFPERFSVPDLGNQFESGEYIGPNLLAGNIAFGRPPNNGGNYTPITSRTQATAYAEFLKNSGYEYIKEYWYLNPTVLDQFEQESERLNLPIIGHIPRTRPMAQSLSHGHIMSAHIQEPWVTYMNSRINPNLIQPTIDIFLENGTYMTPTLAVFDSWIRIYGGNQQQYNAIIQREGSQYINQSLRNQWRGFYRSFLNQQAGSLDPLYDFFELMTLEYYQAGVPLLIGTDAPGFPGVMSGFGAYVEMQLFEQVGIPVYGIYQAASKNAGDFVDDTLHPEISFGTIEVGKRADIIITENNPLVALENLHRPFAVMAAGHMWSQEFLQTKLDALITINKSIKTKAQPYTLGVCAKHLAEIKLNY